MAPVIVLAQRDGNDGGAVSRSTCVLLTIARRLGTPVAVLCGAIDDGAVTTLGRYGAETIYAAGDRPTGALVAVAERITPGAILIGAGYVGQEVAARVAVRLNSGIITDAVEVRPGPTAVQVCLANSYLVESEVRRGTPIITVRPEAANPSPCVSPIEPRIEAVEVEAERNAARVVFRAPRPRGFQPRLEAADVVVAGGRGVGSRESFALVEQLAAALGGAVAASHTATALGWCPPDLRVGLTGNTVHPRLYVAAGISGSVRHRAGMQGSKTVVAIDDDPAAPIFRIADFGVVGDVHAVVPALLAEIARRRPATRGSVPEDGDIALGGEDHADHHTEDRTEPRAGQRIEHRTEQRNLAEA